MVDIILLSSVFYFLKQAVNVNNNTFPLLILNNRMK